MDGLHGTRIEKSGFVGRVTVETSKGVESYGALGHAHTYLALQTP